MSLNEIKFEEIHKKIEYLITYDNIFKEKIRLT